MADDTTTTQQPQRDEPQSGVLPMSWTGADYVGNQPMAPAQTFTRPGRYDDSNSVFPPDVAPLAEQRSKEAERAAGLIEKNIEERSRIADQYIAPPPLPQYQRMTPPPQENYQSVFKAAAPGLIFTTLLGSLMARNHGQGAMQAAAGYMEGFHTGDKEKIERNREIWEDQMKALIANNKVETDQYNAILNNKEFTWRDKTARIAALTANIGDQAVASKFRIGDYDAGIKLIEDRWKVTENAANKMELERVRQGVPGINRVEYDRAVSDFRTANNGREPSPQEAMHIADQVDPMDEQRRANAERYDQTGTFPPNIGKGVQGGAQGRQIIQDATRLAVGEGRSTKDWPSRWQDYKATGTGKSAAARVGATQAANFELIIRNAHAQIPAAVAASDAVARGSWVPLNKLRQMSEASISNKELKQFKLDNLQLAEVWARAMNPRGVMRIDDREKALDILDLADSKETYRVVANGIKKFLEREYQSVQDFLKHKPLEELPDVSHMPTKDQFRESLKVTVRPSDASGLSDAELKKKLGIE